MQFERCRMPLSSVAELVVEKLGKRQWGLFECVLKVRCVINLLLPMLRNPTNCVKTIHDLLKEEAGTTIILKGTLFLESHYYCATSELLYYKSFRELSKNWTTDRIRKKTSYEQSLREYGESWMDRMLLQECYEMNNIVVSPVTSWCHIWGTVWSRCGWHKTTAEFRA